MSDHHIPPSLAFPAKLASVSTPNLRSAAHADRPVVHDVPYVEVDNEQAHLQVMRGRLDALQSILTQLSTVLDSVNETHTYIAGQVNDLEMYIAGLVPSRTGDDESVAAATPQTKTVQRRGQNKGSFWSKLNLNR